jgi:alginate O-acetyltransferase complex protein AlgI
LLIRTKLSSAQRFMALTAGVAGDLLVLGYFKYAGFLAANLNALFSTQLSLNVLLPVGISFYTFTQIAFLVDAYHSCLAPSTAPGNKILTNANSRRNRSLSKDAIDRI